MPDFNKGSTFNKDANFQGVKFGADAPLLETELNELQDIQTEARAEIIRDSIPSGFVKLGELDYDYMLNNENCVKLKTDSVAYVNGYKILIPKDTIVDIGKAPEKDAREDLLFLEVWKEEVTKDSILTVAGGEGQAQISNTILDDRIGQETARRIALKWRIRHVADINFESSSLVEGLAFKGGGIYDSIYTRIPYPQGGNSEPLIYNSFKSNDERFMTIFRTATLATYAWQVTPFISDVGLLLSKSNLNKTFDGYVYAIPMFRLYRKPSCGKAIPFEYQKINPKVDYSKFTNLMKEEKVERVISETIGGRSLVNLLSNVKKENYSLSSKVTLGSSNIITLTTNTGSGYSDFQLLKDSIPLKTSTDYTFIVNVIETSYTSGKLYFGDTLSTSYPSKFKDTKAIPLSKTGVKVFKLSTKDSFENVMMDSRDFAQTPINEPNAKAVFQYMILEGDWTNKEILGHFTGLKSLGEDEGNLITVRNAILNESSYDPDTGTPKLNTVEGANYITSENLIMPNIEAQVKRGETKLSDLNSFDKVDNMVGDEVVDFTKIKGRTLQNLVSIKQENYNNLAKTDITISDGIITGNGVSEYRNFFLSKNNLFKPSTKYTIICNVLSNTLNGNCCIVSSATESIFVDETYYIEPEESGIFRHTTVTKDDISTCTISLRSFISNLATSGTIKLKYMILEGDYTNIPLDQIPFIEGIKSVGENEDNKVVVKRTGKNLFNMNKCESFNDKGDHYTPNKLYKYNEMIFNLKPNTKYALTIKKIKGNTCWIGFRIDGTYANNKNLDIFTHEFISNSSGKCSIYIGANTEQDISLAKVEYIQLEELISTDFEPYKEEYKQEITLKEPLRSLPNGICDTIEGNKVIRRVGKAILNGTETILKIDQNTLENTLFFRFKNTEVKKEATRISMISDKFPGLTPQLVWKGYDNEGIGAGTELGDGISIRILKSRLATQDIPGFKTWLSQNPTTVYYELATPIEEPIEPNYDKESIKTYQLDEPLRALPNGVKDEIVGNKLIRRCGEVIVDGTEYIVIAEDNTNTVRATITKEVCNPKTSVVNLICDKLPCFAQEQLGSLEVNGISTHSSRGFQVRLNKSLLSTPDATGVQNWLKSNPLKVVYDLITPMEIPLKEVLPSKADFSLARQFNYTDNYLLELPNGVTDTVENGKVTRRVKKIVLNGSEDWADSSSLVLTNTLAFRVIPSDKKVNTEIFCDKFKYVHHNSLTTLDEEFITGQGTTSQVYIRIAKSRLSSPDLTGFKAWLSANPITVLYELNTPTTEELSGNNNRYCPYHEEDNTYCGSLYVGNGTVDTFVENGLKNDGVVIDTPFRSITNKEVVTDCKYKKSVDGYDNMYTVSKSKNLLNPLVGTLKNNAVIHEVSYERLVISQPGTWGTYTVPLKNILKPNTVYNVSGTINKLDGSDGSPYIQVHNVNSNEYLLTRFGKFKTSSDVSNINFYFVANDGNSKYSKVEFINVQLEEGDLVTAFEPFVPIEKAFENTEKNDIEDLRHQVSLTGFNYEQILNESFDKLLIGEL